jgi:transketolase
VFRPADANETAQAWKYALENNDGPVAMCLTRQGLPVIDQDKFAGAENLYKGGYALIAEDNPDVILMATGSEVQLAVSAHEQLAADGIKAQVVSMPSFELFEKQDQAYKDSVIPPAVKARVGIEAGIEQGWGRYLGDGGIFIGMSSFGISAPAAKCFERFGITLENVVAAAKKSVGK